VLAKGGLHAVTRALAIEYAGQGIHVNTVALGAIKTPENGDEKIAFMSPEPFLLHTGFLPRAYEPSDGGEGCLNT